MAPSPAAGFCAALAVALLAVAPAGAAPPEAPAGANELSMQVAALRAVHDLGLTARQRREWEGLCAGAAGTEKRAEAKASAKVRAALADVREAYLKGDAKAIDAAEVKLDEAYGMEEPEVNDEVYPTAAARRKSAEAVALLAPAQITEYLGTYREDVPDLAELLATAAARGRKLKGDDWKSARDDAAAEVGRLAGGVDAARAERFRDRAALLLDLSRKGAGDPPGRAEYDREVKAWLGPDANWVVLRNALQCDVAELLANPQLPAALEARRAGEK